MSEYTGIGSVVTISYGGGAYEVAFIIPNRCPMCNPPVDIFHITNPDSLPPLDPQVPNQTIYTLFYTGIIGDTFIDDDGLNAAEFTITSYSWPEEMMGIGTIGGAILGFIGGAAAAIILNKVLK